MKFAKRQKIAIGFFFTFLIGILVGYGITQKSLVKNGTTTNTVSSATPSSQKTDLNLKNLFEVWDILQTEYLKSSKLERETLVSSAIKGFVYGLKDPYTVYMDREESKEFEENLNGNLEGIGALLEIKNGELIIVTPLKNSPAEKAGLKTGDVIYKINGQETTEMPLGEAVSKIRGKPGTQVILTIIRENKPDPFDITIIRGKIEVESVTLEEPQPGIFHIQINQFSDDTQDELLKTVNEILLKKPSGVILDLRFNGGGYLDIAVEMLSVFLPENKIAVKIRKRAPATDEILYTTGSPRLPDIPLVVLVNQGSASASEIVAGTIQDYKRGIVMGEKTFGKGSVQEIKDLADGSSLRITTAEWLTPLDRNIDEIGITPDIIIPFPKDTPEEKDPQLEEALRYFQQK